MRLKKVSLRGMTRFDEKVEVDFENLGKIVAVVGRNGSGKTTLLEAVPAALYRRLPSRPGSLYDHAKGSDAYVQAEFSGGLLARTLVDADRRSTESYLLKDGDPIVNGKAAEYAAAVDKTFGSQALFLSSVFACQTKAGSFLSLPKAERKALLIEMLGLEKLQVMSEKARHQANLTMLKLASLRGSITQVTVPAGAIEEAVEAVSGFETDLFLLDAAVEQADRGVQEAREVRTRLQQIAEGLEGVRIQHKGAEARVRNVLDAVEAGRVAHTKNRVNAMRRVEDAQQALVSGQAANMREMERLGERMARALVLVAKKTQVQAAVVRVSELRLELEESRLGSAAAERLKLEQGRAALIGRAPCSVAVGWLEAERPDMSDVNDNPVDLRGTCPLLDNARLAERMLPGLEQVAGKPRRDVSVITEEMYRAELLAGHASAVEAAISEVSLIERERRSVVEAWQVRQAQCEDAIIDARSSFEGIPKEPPTGEPELTAAQDWLDEATLNLKNALKEAQDIQSAEHAVTNAEAALRQAKDKQQIVTGTLAAVREQLANLQRCALKFESISKEIVEVGCDISEWNLLAEALGRDGVQALEIDAVGPGIAAVTNELLDACYGSRFRIEFATLREKKTGGQMESFDIKVYDNGRECLVENLSGGEKTVVSEALGLAIAVVNARSSGVHWETLWRDETAGALDPEAAQAYVEMLRRAADVGGFKQVVFVSHSPEVWQRADTRVELVDGVVSIN